MLGTKPSFNSEQFRIRAADAHHEIAEGTVDVLTATLHGRVVWSIHQVNCHVGSLKNKNTYGYM